MPRRLESTDRPTIGIRRRLAMLAAVAGVALAGVVATAPAASANHGCDAGEVCVFAYRSDGSHVLAFQSEGNLTSWVGVSYWGGYVWNHGTYWPGADHIEVKITDLDGNRYETCLHYGPVSYSGDPTAVYLSPFTTVTGLRWRGECANSEEGWHPY